MGGWHPGGSIWTLGQGYHRGTCMLASCALSINGHPTIERVAPTVRKQRAFILDTPADFIDAATLGKNRVVYSNCTLTCPDTLCSRKCAVVRVSSHSGSCSCLLVMAAVTCYVAPSLCVLQRSWYWNLQTHCCVSAADMKIRHGQRLTCIRACVCVHMCIHACK
jgi:hypothetical protein